MGGTKMYTQESEEKNEPVSFHRKLTEEEKRELYEEAREAWIGDQKAREERALEQGIEQGIEKNKVTIARELLNIGLPIEQIANVTKLSIEKIKNL